MDKTIEKNGKMTSKREIGVGKSNLNREKRVRLGNLNWAIEIVKSALKSKKSKKKYLATLANLISYKLLDASYITRRSPGNYIDTGKSRVVRFG